MMDASGWRLSAGNCQTQRRERRRPIDVPGDRPANDTVQEQDGNPGRIHKAVAGAKADQIHRPGLAEPVRRHPGGRFNYIRCRCVESVACTKARLIPACIDNCFMTRQMLLACRPSPAAQITLHCVIAGLGKVDPNRLESRARAGILARATPVNMRNGTVDGTNYMVLVRARASATISTPLQSCTINIRASFSICDDIDTQLRWTRSLDTLK